MTKLQLLESNIFDTLMWSGAIPQTIARAWGSSTDISSYRPLMHDEA